MTVRCLSDMLPDPTIILTPDVATAQALDMLASFGVSHQATRVFSYFDGLAPDSISTVALASTFGITYDIAYALSCLPGAEVVCGQASVSVFR